MIAKSSAERWDRDRASEISKIPWWPGRTYTFARATNHSFAGMDAPSRVGSL